MRLDRPEREFSYRADGPLDMRMGPDAERAKDIMGGARRARARIVFEYGEERRSRRVAAAIVRARSRSPIETTDELAGVSRARWGRGGAAPTPPAGRSRRSASRSTGRLEELAASLPRAVEILAPGGRVVVIAYHSPRGPHRQRFCNGAETSRS